MSTPIDGTTVYAPTSAVESVVAEHSAGETMVTAIMTANARGETRPIVVYGERLTSARAAAQTSVLLHLARDLMLMACRDLTGPAAILAESAAREIERAGLAQKAGGAS